MVAERDGVDAGVEQLALYILRNYEATGGVLAVSHDQIELPVAHQLRHALGDNGPPTAADNIADEKNTHALRALERDHLALG
jgi:hypothetical protein